MHERGGYRKRDCSLPANWVIGGRIAGDREWGRQRERKRERESE